MSQIGEQGQMRRFCIIIHLCTDNSDYMLQETLHFVLKDCYGKLNKKFFYIQKKNLKVHLYNLLHFHKNITIEKSSDPHATNKNMLLGRLSPIRVPVMTAETSSSK